jgi:hypothetical protein
MEGSPMAMRAMPGTLMTFWVPTPREIVEESSCE